MTVFFTSRRGGRERGREGGREGWFLAFRWLLGFCRVSVPNLEGVLHNRFYTVYMEELTDKMEGSLTRSRFKHANY